MIPQLISIVVRQVPKHLHSLVSGIISHKHKYTIIIQCDTNRKLQPFQAVSGWTLTGRRKESCAPTIICGCERGSELACGTVSHVCYMGFVGNQFQKVAPHCMQLSPISIIVTINCAIIGEMFGNGSTSIHPFIY